MAGKENASHAHQEIQSKKSNQIALKDIPGEDRGLGERALRGGEGFNKWTKRLQLGGALVLAPFPAGASALLLAGGAVDHMQQDYTNSWAEDIKRKREQEIATKYGPNKVVIKGKVVDRNTIAYKQTAQSESVGIKMLNAMKSRKEGKAPTNFDRQGNADVVDIKALE
ncbi:MAG: hypothetical protein H0W89_08050, partial [Candidatus Levybacteria bacterium]|nr:hypothetical protein [Candidatus Levybacteria bacterium]